MSKKLILALLTITIIVVGGVLGYSSYVSGMSRKNADNIMAFIKDMNLGAVYNNLDDEIKNKYKTKEEFVEKFPMSDFMNPTNKEVFLTKSVQKGRASYSYFLPNQDKVDEGIRVIIEIPYSAFDKNVLDITVQEDTAPVQ